MKTFIPLIMISYNNGWVIKMDVTELISKLGTKEINTLLKIYYQQGGIFEDSYNLEEEIINSLTEKKLISVSIDSNENILNLTDDGLNVCGTVMFNRINENQNQFKIEIKKLPERAVSCFVKRILWKDEAIEENGFVDPIRRNFFINENLWYERTLLDDEKICSTLEKFYSILENFGFIENNNGQRWCLTEVENFLKEEYRNIMNLTWNEEDSLKYYYFFLNFAKEQKNLINFSGNTNEYRSVFYSDTLRPADYMYPTTGVDSKTILTSYGLSEKRIIGFLKDMQTQGIVYHRFQPISSESYFGDSYKIFIVKDITNYLDYLKIQFLKPVVDSLLS
jgi:hypothetical protein